MSAFGPITAIEASSGASGRTPSFRRSTMLFRAIVRASARCDDVPTASAARRRIDVRLVEQPELELRRRARGAPRRRACARSTRPDFERVEERLAVAVGGGKLDVEPGAERHRRRAPGRPPRAGGTTRELPDREVVGDDVAVEPPLVAQDRGEELAIGRADDAVDLVVRVHHGAERRPTRTAASNGWRYTSRSSRGGMPAGAQFIPPSEAP